MPVLNSGELHVDARLTTFSLMFTQDADNFVATAASTPVPVQFQSDLYLEITRGDQWRDEARERPLGGEPHEIGFSSKDESYRAQEYALQVPIDDRERANAARSGMDPDDVAVTTLTEKQLIKADRIWATNFFKTGVWGTDVTGVGSSPSATQFLQFDVSGSDPIETVDKWRLEVIRRTGRKPNVIVMGADVYASLRSHPQVQEAIKYTQTGILTRALLASLFDVERVVVPYSIYNNAMEGADDNFEFIVNTKAMAMLYIAPTPSTRIMTAISKFNWTGLLGGAANDAGGVIMRGRRGLATSDIIQSRSAWDQKLVCADCGVYFDQVVG